MAEKVIRHNQSLVPFFGERISFIRGLDPLGLQQSSEATFARLLPGLNNVTGRIRYYSFYCWLLDAYSKQNRSTDPKEQQRFIRRAEYIIALAMQYAEGDNFGISGSNYAFQEVKVARKTAHDLQDATFKPDGSTEKTYWNYSSGIFGQYYLPSLRDVGLVRDREEQSGVYMRTNFRNENHISGEKLAAAFDANLSAEVRQLFFSCIGAGRINEEQLRALLKELNLTIIPTGTEEQQLLLKLLLQKDYPLRIEEEPSTLRRQTIKHLLRFAGKGSEVFNDRHFVYNAYDSKGKVACEVDACLYGWYYYQFNEFWQYANTSLFNGTLTYLRDTRGPGWAPVQQLLSEIADGVIKEFMADQLMESAEDRLEGLLNRVEGNEYLYLDATRKVTGIPKVANGFLLLFAQYLNNRQELIELKNYAQQHELDRDGDGAEYFTSRFHIQQSVRQYITRYLYPQIIYRHQYVAFRKMGNSTLSTQKFIIEDQHIRYLANFEAGYTGPRINNLIGFFRDLGVIRADGKLTDAGIALLRQIDQIDD